MKKNGRLFFTILLLFVFLPVLPLKAEENYVIDETGTLTTEETDQLNAYAQSVSQQYECGIYVVFTDDLNGYSEEEYAQGVYMNHNLGYGNDASGVLLAIAVDERYFNSVSYGSAGDVFTQSVQEEMQDDILSYLSNDEWYSAAETWIDNSEQILSEGNYHYHENTYSDPAIDTHITQTSPEERRNAWLGRLPIAFIAALIISLIINFARRSILKTTGTKKEAGNYIKPGSMNLNIAQDYYAGTTRSVQRIPRSNSSGESGGGHSYHSSGFSGGGSGHHF